MTIGRGAEGNSLATELYAYGKKVDKDLAMIYTKSAVVELCPEALCFRVFF